MDKLHQIIEDLSAESTVSLNGLRRQYWVTVFTVTLVVGFVALWVFNALGASVRLDYFKLVQNPLIATKQVVPFVIFLAAAPLGVLLMRPEAQLSMNMLPLGIVLLIFPALTIGTLLLMTSDLRGSATVGNGFAGCLISILFLSVALTTAQILVVRKGAVTKPIAAGAIIGVGSGAISALIYAFICTEDSPAFYGLWYSIGILLAGLTGAFIGKFALRW
ncbi:NrsF family protein [Arenicellales bacterium nBUS_48]